jgi:hypothetical protein
LLVEPFIVCVGVSEATFLNATVQTVEPFFPPKENVGWGTLELDRDNVSFIFRIGMVFVGHKGLTLRLGYKGRLTISEEHEGDFDKIMKEPSQLHITPSWHVLRRKIAVAE